jgi:glucokinase
VIALDPARVAVGGGMVRSWDVLGAALEKALDAAVPYPPELVLAAFPHDAALLGALALGVEAASAPAGSNSAGANGGVQNGRSADRVSPQMGSTGEGQ